MISVSWRLFILARIRAGNPWLARSVSLWINSSRRGLSVCGAAAIFWYWETRVRPVTALKKADASAPYSLRAVR